MYDLKIMYNLILFKAKALTIRLFTNNDSEFVCKI